MSITFAFFTQIMYVKNTGRLLPEGCCLLTRQLSYGRFFMEKSLIIEYPDTLMRFLPVNSPATLSVFLLSFFIVYLGFLLYTIFHFFSAASIVFKEL